MVIQGPIQEQARWRRDDQSEAMESGESKADGIRVQECGSNVPSLAVAVQTPQICELSSQTSGKYTKASSFIYNLCPYTAPP